MDYVNLPDGIYTRAHVHYGIGGDKRDATVLQSWLPLYDLNVVHVEVKEGAVRGVTQKELDAEAAQAVALEATAVSKKAEKATAKVASVASVLPVPAERPVRVVDYSSYSYKALKVALKERGLNAFGKKVVLLERLQAASE